MSAPLITAAQRERMLAHGRRTAEGIDHDPEPVVWLFTPFGPATWLLTELDPDDPDIAFGLCDLGMGFPELGSVSIAELRSVYRFAVPAVERDRHFRASAPLSAYVDAAYREGAIVEPLPVSPEGRNRPDDPVALAWALTPGWMRDILDYDGLEIHPVRRVEIAGTPCFEPCAPEEAACWSVFGHRKTGGLESFEDFESRSAAEDFAQQLLTAWPHLRAFGLLGARPETTERGAP